MIAATIACLELLATTPHTEVVEWACPVPYFGDPARARIATVGLNPSNKEFVDDDLAPLVGHQQRLPTRVTLGLGCWGDAGPAEVRAIDDACRRYFDGNAYDRWFGVLENLLAAVGSTFYGLDADACHLDLVPFATTRKWGDIPQASRRAIAEAGSHLFGRLLADSSVHTVILNGRSVVEAFESLGYVYLDRIARDDWALPRANGASIAGTAYSGVVHHYAGYDLGRPLRVVGFNHNLQSSYGVTSEVKRAIAAWVADELLHD